MYRSRVILAAAVTVGLVSGCADTPTSPTALQPSQPSSPTSPLPPPQTPVGPPVYTLSGVIFETSSAGRLPVSDALVEVGVCAPNRSSAPARIVSTRTDLNGAYRVAEVCSGTAVVWVTKTGYQTSPPEQCDGDCLLVRIDAKDTQFDVQLVR